MANQRHPFSANIPYHIYNRGWDKKRIFFQAYDYFRFISTLRNLQEEYKQDLLVLAFCLLPNHFHLIIKSFTTGLVISKFMKRLQGTHSMYVKIKYEDVFPKGIPVFGQRFGSQKIADEDYLQQCYYYVHHNAIKHSYVDDIRDRPYTSLHYLDMWKDKIEVVLEKKSTRDSEDFRNGFETGLG